ncbi:MAG: hypothetical protein ABJP45_03360 [Cyclobacteriaceae bacterium]
MKKILQLLIVLIASSFTLGSCSDSEPIPQPEIDLNSTIDPDDDDGDDPRDTPPPVIYG